MRRSYNVQYNNKDNYKSAIRPSKATDKHRLDLKFLFYRAAHSFLSYYCFRYIKVRTVLVNIKTFL